MYVARGRTDGSMARNYEKRFTGLNRFLEAKERDLEKTLETHRPPLHKLSSAEEVKKWIPSIKREMDYCLQQLSGVESRSYPEYKVKEFQERVEKLQKEHKRFVEKVHSLDPESRGTVPWQPRGYSRRKRSHDCHVTSSQAKRLCSPLIQQEKESNREAPATSSLGLQHLEKQEAVEELCVTTDRPLPPQTILSLPGLDYSSSSEEEQ